MSGSRMFHLGDVISCTIGNLVSPRHMDGVYDLLGFVTGESLFTHQLPRAFKESKEAIMAQLPSVDWLEVQAACDALEATLSGSMSAEDRNVCAAIWLNEQVGRWGEFHELRPLAPGSYKAKDPISELCEMVGPEKVLAVNAPSPADRN